VSSRFFTPELLWPSIVGSVAMPILSFIQGFHSNFSFRWRLLFWAIMLTVVNMLVGLLLPPFSVLWNYLLVKLILRMPGFANIETWKSSTLFFFAAFLVLIDAINPLPLLEFGTACLSFAIAGKLVAFNHPFAHPWLFLCCSFRLLVLCANLVGDNVVVLYSILLAWYLLYVVLVMVATNLKTIPITERSPRIFRVVAWYIKVTANFSLELYCWHMIICRLIVEINPDLIQQSAPTPPPQRA
jgi:hypothetical protein